MHNYEEGNYQVAKKRLQFALEEGLSRPDRVKAHKYLAFIACVSSQQLTCREEFAIALELDPKFELDAAGGRPSDLGTDVQERQGETDRRTAMINATASRPCWAATRSSRELGQGAMGMVYKARDPMLDRIVAIKTINLTLPKEELAEYEARFYQEAKAAGGLSHRNIVTIYDIGRSERVAYMAMEFLEGQELRRLIRRG